VFPAKWPLSEVVFFLYIADIVQESVALDGCGAAAALGWGTGSCYVLFKTAARAGCIFSAM
jgi:hypothetical protein